MLHTEKLNDLHGRTVVNIVSGETFHVYDKNSSRLPKPPGWLSLRTMEDEINRILSRAESKFCAPTGGVCTPKPVGLLARRHITAGDFHYIGKEASTGWAGGPDPSMLADAGALGPGGRNLPRIRKSGRRKISRSNPSRSKAIFYSASVSPVRSCQVRHNKLQKGKNTIKSRKLRKLIKVIHYLHGKPECD